MNQMMIQLAWANIKGRSLTSLLTVVTLAIAVALISILLQFNAYFEKRLSDDFKAIDLVVGSKGSPMQIVLSSVLHIDVPTGNIPLAAAQLIQKDRLVKNAIPLALGDSYQGYRIVGTSPGFLDLYGASVARGQLWSRTNQIVVGAEVARRLNLTLGSQIQSYHGISTTNTGAVHDHAALTVMGIVQPTGTVVDRLILTSVTSVWAAHGMHEGDEHDHHDAHKHEGHDHEYDHEKGHDEHDHDHDSHKHDKHDHDDHADHDHDSDHTESHADESHDHDSGDSESHESHDHHDDAQHHSDETSAEDIWSLDPETAEGKEITALLIQYKSPLAAVQLPRKINKREGLQAAAPAMEITRLYSLLSGFFQAAELLGYLLVVIGTLSIFTTMSQASSQKLYDMALLRAKGVKAIYVFLQQLYEGLILTTLSAGLGLALGHFTLFILSLFIPELQNLSITGMQFYLSELYLAFATLGIGALAVLWPAVKSYRTDPVILLKAK